MHQLKATPTDRPGLGLLVLVGLESQQIVSFYDSEEPWSCKPGTFGQHRCRAVRRGRAAGEKRQPFMAFSCCSSSHYSYTALVLLHSMNSVKKRRLAGLLEWISSPKVPLKWENSLNTLALFVIYISVKKWTFFHKYRSTFLITFCYM